MRYDVGCNDAFLAQCDIRWSVTSDAELLNVTLYFERLEDHM